MVHGTVHPSVEYFPSPYLLMNVDSLVTGANPLLCVQDQTKDGYVVRVVIGKQDRSGASTTITYKASQPCRYAMVGSSGWDAM